MHSRSLHCRCCIWSQQFQTNAHIQVFTSYGLSLDQRSQLHNGEASSNCYLHHYTSAKQSFSGYTGINLSVCLVLTYAFWYTSSP